MLDPILTILGSEPKKLKKSALFLVFSALPLSARGRESGQLESSGHHFFTRDRPDPIGPLGRPDILLWTDVPIFNFLRIARPAGRNRTLSVPKAGPRFPALCPLFYFARARAKLHLLVKLSLPNFSLLDFCSTGKMNFCETQIAQPAPLPKPFQQILVSLERSEPDLSNDAGISRNGFSSGAG